MQWAPPLMSSWPTAPQALPLAPALNQQKRRSDEMDQSSLKRVRYVPPPGNEPPLHTIFSQQIARTNTDEATDVEIDDAPSARPKPILVCDTRACPPCFAHRFCRPNMNCLVADTMMMD